MKTLCYAFVTILLIPATFSARGQGCSDAGFCTLNGFKPNNILDTATGFLKNQFKIGVSAGQADKSIIVWGNYIEYLRQVNNKIELAAKITSLAQNGNGISTFGLSDIYFNASYKVVKKAKLTIGAKFPFNHGDKTKNNLPLPMNYQTSLGTFDLIIGAGYEINRLQLIAGLQQPLSQNNNHFLADNEPPGSMLKQFQSTNKFVRSGDVLLRISYPLNSKSKLKLTPGLLPIYHLSNDKFTNAQGEQKIIQGSQGLTLNANVYLDYKLNTKNILQLNFGAPLKVRKSKPEGLNRRFVVNLEYKIIF